MTLARRILYCQIGGLTRKEEEQQPVHKQDRPEDRHVENLKPTASKSKHNGARRPVPKLELWQSSNKRPELVILPGGKSAHTAILHLIVDGFV